jgi:hypothetical protein
MQCEGRAFAKGVITPAVKMAGREIQIFAEQDRKLEAVRERGVGIPSLTRKRITPPRVTRAVQVISPDWQRQPGAALSDQKPSRP